MTETITRRRFIKWMAWTPWTLRTLATRYDPSLGASRVVVVGAGLAGLAAAYELSNNGCSTLLLEAQHRCGGRVLTLRNSFDDGLRAEAGAMVLTDANENVLRYARMLNIPLIQYASGREPAYILYWRQQRFRITLDSPLPPQLGLTEEERAMGLSGLWDRYVLSPLTRLLSEQDTIRAMIQRYDDLTMAEFLRKEGASEAAVSVMRLGYLDSYGEGIDHVGAVQFLRAELLELSARRVYLVQGGTDTLPAALAEQLSGLIRYGTRLVAVKQEEAGIRVIVEDERGEKESIKADYMILTLPLPTLRRVSFDPPLTRKKQQAIEEIAYTSVTRTFLQCSERFWVNDDVVGDADTDLPIMRVIEQPVVGPSLRGILEAFVAGEQARRFQAMAVDARIQAALEGIEKVHPGTMKHFERGASWCWDSFPYARGAFCWFKPGQIAIFSDDLRKPDGRIHFAGEHTSSWTARMEGALESGARAASEVLKRIRS